MKKETATPKIAKRRRVVTQVVTRPAEIIIDVDMAFLIAAAPKLKIKDMTVFAMAIGGRMVVPKVSGGFVKWQIAIEVL
jgi:hypothetical protein